MFFIGEGVEWSLVRYRKRLLEKEVEPERRSAARGRFVIVVLLHARHTPVRQCAAEEGMGTLGQLDPGLVVDLACHKYVQAHPVAGDFVGSFAFFHRGIGGHSGR